MIKNNLLSANSQLVMEWHPTRNVGLNPQKLSSRSNKKVWWRCQKGHEWEAAIYGRTQGNGCPYCSGRLASEGYSLGSQNPALALEWHPLKNGALTPLDVTPGSDKKVWWRCQRGHDWKALIPDRAKGSGCPYCAGQKVSTDNCLEVLNPTLAQEWHPSKNGELKPGCVTPMSHKKVWWLCKKGHEWKAIVASRSKGSGCPQCSAKAARRYDYLEAFNPNLALEWHPTKNGDLTPGDVTPMSNLKVWWQCQKGHEWDARIANRSKGNGCPFCSGRLATKQYCLESLYPTLALEWHPGRNGVLTPEVVTPNSSKKVWWRCKKGHEWEARIANRSKGNGCPFCSGQAVCTDNCLEVRNPKLALEWHPEKNGQLTPKDVTLMSNKKVWWLCNNGHSWEAVIYSRSHGIGCPYCSGRIASDRTRKH
jgi:translation initiation factor IF-1